MLSQRVRTMRMSKTSKRMQWTRRRRLCGISFESVHHLSVWKAMQRLLTPKSTSGGAGRLRRTFDVDAMSVVFGPCRVAIGVGDAMKRMGPGWEAS